MWDSTDEIGLLWDSVEYNNFWARTDQVPGSIEAVDIPIISMVLDSDASTYTIIPRIRPPIIATSTVFGSIEHIKPGAIIRYDATLGDLELSVKNFTAYRSNQNNGLSHLSVVIYDYDLLDEINDRSDENLTLRKKYEVNGTITETIDIMIVSDVVINNSEGRFSKTIQITGERLEIFIPKNINQTEGYIYKQLQNGKINASYYTINPIINPGDTIVIDPYNVIVGKVSMSFSFSEDGSIVNERMYITEA